MVNRFFRWQTALADWIRLYRWIKLPLITYRPLCFEVARIGTQNSGLPTSLHLSQCSDVVWPVTSSSVRSFLSTPLCPGFWDYVNLIQVNSLTATLHSWISMKLSLIKYRPLASGKIASESLGSRLRVLNWLYHCIHFQINFRMFRRYETCLTSLSVHSFLSRLLRRGFWIWLPY